VESTELGLHASAIICVNDLMALGVLRALREHGLEVPGDVSVVGCDNIWLSEYTTPPLTTSTSPRPDRARDLFGASGARGSSNDAVRDIIIRPELIIRESTGPAGESRLPHYQPVGEAPAESDARVAGPTAVAY